MLSGYRAHSGERGLGPGARTDERRGNGYRQRADPRDGADHRKTSAFTAGLHPGGPRFCQNGPLQAMLAAHTGPVLGLHPMFGPDSGSPAKQVVVYCDGRQPEAYQWFLEQIQVWGARLHRISAVEHDQNMAFIQALRHFATFAYGLHLAEENVQRTAAGALITDLSSGTGDGWTSVCAGSPALRRHYYVVRK